MPFISLKRREPTMIMRADRAREAGQWQLAAGLYRIALDRTPNKPPIWIQYGHALKESGNHVEAETAYRTAIAYAPDDADAHLQLGHVLKLQGKTAEARASYLWAVALDRSLAGAVGELIDLGSVREHLPWIGGHPAPGTAAAAVPLNGRPVAHPWRRQKESIVTRADRARDAGHWPLAVQLYRKALDRNPRNPPIWVQYGHALKESGQLTEAAAAYRCALSYQRAADTYIQLGHVLKLQRNINDAQTAYLRSLFVDSSSLSEALNELAGLGWSPVQLAELHEFTLSPDRDEFPPLKI